MDTTSIAIENLSRTHILSQISKTTPVAASVMAPSPTSTAVAVGIPSLILENRPTSQPLDETFPRYSAFEKVVQTCRKNDLTESKF